MSPARTPAPASAAAPTRIEARRSCASHNPILYLLIYPTIAWRILVSKKKEIGLVDDVFVELLLQRRWLAKDDSLVFRREHVS